MITNVYEHFNVTPEQVAQATRQEYNGRVWYIVPSATEADKEYMVWYDGFKLRCEPCPSYGNCWHRRAAMAAAELYRQERFYQRYIQEATQLELPLVA